MIAPDCHWESWQDNRAQRAGPPTMQPRTGPEGVAQFFAAVGELDIREFQVLDRPRSSSATHSGWRASCRLWAVSGAGRAKLSA